MVQKREKCGGPGAKIIFATKAEALEEFRRVHANPNRRARPGKGEVHRCSWGGDHWHISSSNGRRRR